MFLKNKQIGRLFWLLPLIGIILIWGCINSEKNPDTFDLPSNFADSLSRFESVLIILKDTSGHPLDTLFKGNVKSASQLKNLSAPHYPGGKMIVTIIGYQDGKITYQVDRIFNGGTGETEKIIPPQTPRYENKIERR